MQTGNYPEYTRILDSMQTTLPRDTREAFTWIGASANTAK